MSVARILPEASSSTIRRCSAAVAGRNGCAAASANSAAIKTWSHSSGWLRKRCHGLAERRSAVELGHSMTLGTRTRGRRGRSSHNSKMAGIVASSHNAPGTSKRSTARSSLEDACRGKALEEDGGDRLGGVQGQVAQAESPRRVADIVQKRPELGTVLAELARSKARLTQLAIFAVLQLDLIAEWRVPFLGGQNLQYDVMLFTLGEQPQCRGPLRIQEVTDEKQRTAAAQLRQRRADRKSTRLNSSHIP